MKITIKNILAISIIFSFIAVGSAQKPEQTGNKKDRTEKKIKKRKTSKQEEVREEVEETRRKKENTDKKLRKEKKKVEELDENGHSYGKDKYGLEGKAYGQERARQAKLDKEARVKDLENTVDRGGAEVVKARERVKAVKSKLKEQKKAGEITEEAYEEKMEKLEAIEMEADNLEKKLNKSKNLRKPKDD